MHLSEMNLQRSSERSRGDARRYISDCSRRPVGGADASHSEAATALYVLVDYRGITAYLRRRAWCGFV
jgi:hypothetical protein